MKEGYFLLHRKILDSPLLNIKPFCKGYAWITILALTNYKEGFIKVKNGTLIKVERGECGYSEKALADIFGWSRGKVRRFLEQLKNDEMIQQKIIENHTIIKVLNYKPYQAVQQKIEKTDNKQYNKRTQINKDKEYISNISYINISLSIEEREILKKYILSKPRKEPIQDWDAYFAIMNKNGTLREKFEKAKKWLQAKEEKEKKKREILRSALNDEGEEKGFNENRSNYKEILKKGLLKR